MLTPHATPVSGGGAAALAAPTGGGRARPTFTAEEIGERVDALALKIGTKATASALLLACVVVILIGAQSLLGTMQSMDRDIKEMNEQLVIANEGLKVLNTTMDSLPPTAQSLSGIVATVDATAVEVDKSAKSIDTLAGTTETINGRLGTIASGTAEMRTSLEGAAEGAGGLKTTIGTLNVKLPALVKTQSSMYAQTKKMRGGLDGMNGSLAYTIRILNYITAPPHGQGMMVRADLPKETLPPIPGIRAETEPVPLFPRFAWKVYTGP